jgi:hypothetical protein
MQIVECATFHLNTNDIDFNNNGNVNNQYGSVNQFRNDITWYNVSLKTILGDMYEQYDKFNIKLSSIMYSAVVAPSANGLDLSLKVNVTGLPFSNCTYRTLFNSNSAICTMGAFGLTANASQLYFNDDNVFTIDKPPATTNIRIYLTRLSDAVPTWVSLGPQIDFYFRVYGVKKG